MDTHNKLKIALEQARGLTSGAADSLSAKRDAAAMRLSALKMEMDTILSQEPNARMMFDLPIIAGETPRLWIDQMTSVVMDADNHTFRLVQDHDNGREVLFSTHQREAMVEQMTKYIAHRMVEHERNGTGSLRQETRYSSNTAARKFSEEHDAGQYDVRHTQSSQRHSYSNERRDASQSAAPRHEERVVTHYVDRPVASQPIVHEQFTDEDARQSGLRYNRMRQVQGNASPDRVLVQTHITQHSQFDPKPAQQYVPPTTVGSTTVGSAGATTSYSNGYSAQVSHQEPSLQSQSYSTGHANSYGHSNYNGGNSLSDKLRQPVTYTLWQSIYIWLTGLGFGAAALLALATALKWRF